MSLGNRLGIASLCCSAVYWVPYWVAELPVRPFFSVPLWLTYLGWIGGFVLAIIAGILRPRWWLLAAVIPVLAVWRFIQMIQG